MTDRTTGAELEQLKRKIFVMRSRGMTYRQIGAAVGKSASTVYDHYKDTCRRTAMELEAGGQQEIMGEMALWHRELVQEGLRNLSQVDAGSPMRANWTSITGKRLDAYREFLFTSGLMSKAADKIDLSVQDFRKMSDEEIQREIQQLERKLATTPVLSGDKLLTASNS